MSTNIITIGREPGSGGRLIAARLSEKLGYKVYDKNLLNIASRESGLNREFFEKFDEKASFSIFGSWFGMQDNVTDDMYSGYYLSNETFFRIQSDVIRKIAEQESAIFLGRCADYVLNDHPGLMSVFVTAYLPDRIKRMSEYMDINENKAREWVARSDKKRRSYYNYFSNKEWGHASSYNLCINTSEFGIEKSAELIYQLAVDRFGLK
jgi:cytidylate kinase